MANEKGKGKAKKVSSVVTRFMPATRGEHIHVRPKIGRMKKGDPVTGYPIVGIEFEDGTYQDTLLMVGGVEMTLEELRASLSADRRIDVIPFPVFEACCDLNENRVN